MKCEKQRPARTLLNEIMTTSILKKLFLRETCESIKRSRYSCNSQLFTKIPGRLCYRLSSIVPQDILEEGHVFLGFSRCGQYVVSYSCQMDADDHTALPVYIYKLQWWLFVPNQMLQRILEVRLFGEEDVTQDLFISFCEWPEDSSKVLIFGYSLPTQNQDSCCQCYMTIASVPSLQNCIYCQKLKSECKDKAENPKCLKHGFTVHTKFELTPPFPPFAPRTQLKINEVAVVNTGDSIIALMVTIDGFDDKAQQVIGLTEVTGFIDNQNKEQFLENPRLDSLKQLPKGPNSPSNLCCECRKKGSGQEFNLCASPRQLDLDDESQKENVDTYMMKDYAYQKSPRAGLSEPSGNLKCCKHGNVCHNSSQDWFERYGEDPHMNNDIISTGNASSVMQEVHASGSQIHTIDTEGESKMQHDSVMCLKSPKQDSVLDATKCASPRFDNFSLPQKSCPLHNNCESKDNQGDVSCYSPGPACKSPGPVCSPLQPSSVCNCVGGTRNASQRSFFSPSNSGSTTSTSKSADSVYLQVNDTRTVTYTVRKFSPLIKTGNESPGIVEEDFDLAYRSILPIEVYGDRDQSLSPAHCKEATKKCVRVTQLTFDVEHYLEEVIGHCADWGYRYVAFTNYDLQILDVCPESNTVIGKVFALIHAREDSENNKRVKRNKHTIKLYQTSFCFTWNLKTGAYETQHIGQLSEKNECDIRRKEWKPGHRECALLRRQMFIPQSKHRYVNVLSNESVFKGESLNVIVSPQNYTAILL